MPELVTELPVDIGGWDRLFAESGDEYFFGREPTEAARLTYQYWKILNPDRKGRVLDLGSGEGRDSVFFAGKGFSVTAVEGTDAGIRKMKRLAAEADVNIDSVVQADVLDYRVEPGIEICLAQNVLQFLGPSALFKLAEIQEATAVGGLNSISVFSKEAPLARTLPGLYLFDHGELSERYEGWRLLYRSEHTLWREPIRDYLSFAQVIAQKES